MNMKLQYLKIQNFILLKPPMGAGSNGIVYEGFHINTKQRFAVKVLNIEKVNNESKHFSRIKQELKNLAKISHPNILKLYGVLRTKREIFIFLKLINGLNLQEFMDKHYEFFNKLPSMKIIHHFLNQIAIGLCFMHENNFLHRDLKLENIMLHFDSDTLNENYQDPFCIPLVSKATTADSFYRKIEYTETQPCFKLDDFAPSFHDIFKKEYLDDYQSFEKQVLLAKVVIIDLGFTIELNNGKASSFCGTPITMAPEIWNLKFGSITSTKNEVSYNDKVDMWSLGSISYQLLIGYPPFYANTFQELFREIKKGHYLLPQNINTTIEFVKFINGLLQFNPEKRISWKEILQHDFLLKPVENQEIFILNKEKDIELYSKNENTGNLLWVNYNQIKENYKIEIDSISQYSSFDLSRIYSIEDETKTSIEFYNIFSDFVFVCEEMVLDNYSVVEKDGFLHIIMK